MKILKNTVLCFFMAVSVAGVSSVAMASENSEIAGNVVKQIEAAKQAITDGKSNAEITTLISQAKQESKNILADDKTAGKLQRAARYLGAAIKALAGNDPEEATKNLTEGELAFNKLIPSL